MENRNANKFKSLISGTSNWLEKAKQRKINEAWLKKTQHIALKILLELKAKGLTQSELAVTLNVKPQYVNRIVKGLENLTLETICKIENALGIELVTINNSDIDFNQIIVSGNDIESNKMISSSTDLLKAEKESDKVLLEVKDYLDALKGAGEENSYAMAA